jgi:seryl-tRNA synthetase
MLDIKLIRENPEMVKRNLERRADPEFLKMLDALLENDRIWRQKLTELNNLRRERNQITVEIAKAKKRGESIDQILLKAQEIDEKIADLSHKRSYRSWAELRYIGCGKGWKDFWREVLLLKRCRGSFGPSFNKLCS